MLMIAVALGSSTARIFMQYDKEQPHPFKSSNDKSRWATVRALVENKTYEIDEIIADKDWDTIDKVQHKNRHGVDAFYSSKPPILATMAAGIYWPIYHYDELKGWVTGDKSKDADGNHTTEENSAANADASTISAATDAAENGHRFRFEDYPYDVSAIILIFTNLIPWFVFLVAVAKFADRYGTSTWGRMFVVATAAFGTYLSTFSIVLNNHLPAAASAAIAIYATCRIWIDGQTKLRYFFLAGLFAAFTAAFELPGLALLGVLGLLCLIRAPGRTLLVGLPAAALVVGGFFASNYAAHDTWRPPYMHRTMDLEDPDNWYNFEGSYWANPERLQKDGAEKRSPQIAKEFDAGESDMRTYVFHATIGHHGVFSLTPIWGLSLLGFLIMLFSGTGRRRLLALLLLAVAGVVLSFWLFYLPGEARNYGGHSAGFRHAHWLIPIFLVFLLPAADLFNKSRVLRFVALLLLIASVFAVTYNANNPWTHPWLVDSMVQTGYLPADAVK